MHGLIRNGLEEMLRRGSVSGKEAPEEYTRHLRECAECREELALMTEQSRLLRSLAAPERRMDPPAGFYARVMERIEMQRPIPIWAAFLDPLFGRRLVTASLALVVLLSGYLAFMETGTPRQDTAGITAFQEQTVQMGQDRDTDRDAMLVTLASYRE